MPQPIAFTRIYADGLTGLTHDASPDIAAVAIATMNRVAAEPDAPFPYRIRFRMDDRSVVMVAPKRRGRR